VILDVLQQAVGVLGEDNVFIDSNHSGTSSCVDSWPVYDATKTPPILIEEGGQA